MQQAGKNVDCDGGVGVERLNIFPGTCVKIRKNMLPFGKKLHLFLLP